MEQLFQWLDSFKSANLVRAAFGEPQTVGGRTVIPVARVIGGFGTPLDDQSRGCGDQGGRCVGTADAGDVPVARVRVTPVAVISVGSDGVQVQEIANHTVRLVLGLVVPGLAVACALTLAAWRRARRTAGSN